MPKIYAISFGRLSKVPIGGLGDFLAPSGDEDGLGVELSGEYVVLMNDGTITTTGDIDTGGDIILATDALVDGVDVSDQDALMLRGSSLGTGTETPLTNAMLYYDSNMWKAGHTALLGGSNTTLHYHNTDRDRANHTSTQASSTISDFEHKCFQAELDGAISTNGTTEVDITWDSNKKNGFTHTNGTASINVDQDGEYLIWVTLGSDFNSDNQLMYAHIYKDVGAGFAKVKSGISNTNRGAGCQVTITGYYQSLSAGEDLKITADFSGADAGSNWLADYCELCILKIDGA